MLHRTRTWAHFALILVVVLLTTSIVFAQDAKPEAVGLRPDAPTYALHGPYWVGTKEIETQTDSHPTTVALWYPALNPKGVEETITYIQANTAGDPLPWNGHAIEKAPLNTSGQPYPLVIFAHGLYMARFVSSNLTEHLASYGYVVMAIDYADSFRSFGVVDSDLSMVTSPKDVTWQINYAEKLTAAGGALAGMIDLQNIAVIGHSSGADTTMMAGGARLDFNGPTSACLVYADMTANPELDARPRSVVCSDFVHKLMPLAGLERAPEQLWPSWGDSRVDAIVPLAPNMLFYGTESLKEVTIPTMIMVGSKDHAVRSDLPLYRPYLYDHLNSATKAWVSFENGDHGIFGDSCDAAPWLIDAQLYGLCSDQVWDMDRAHDLINHFTTAFLLYVLKGDKEAAKALAPDAVSFPGIKYEAQGF